MEIVKNSIVQCQWCKVSNRAETWDDNTYSECTSREKRRAYKNIYNKQVWGNNSKNYYKCPNCGKWSKGNQLVLIDKDGNIVRGVGGKAIIEFIKEQ